MCTQWSLRERVECELSESNFKRVALRRWSGQGPAQAHPGRLMIARRWRSRTRELVSIGKNPQSIAADLESKQVRLRRRQDPTALPFDHGCLALWLCEPIASVGWQNVELVHLPRGGLDRQPERARLWRAGNSPADVNSEVPRQRALEADACSKPGMIAVSRIGAKDVSHDSAVHVGGIPQVCCRRAIAEPRDTRT